MTAAISILHGLDYAFTFSLCGLAIFYYFILPAGKMPAQELLSDWVSKFRYLATSALITSVLWLLLVASEMSESWMPSEIWTAISTTRFGHFWSLKIFFLIFVISFMNVTNRNLLGRCIIIVFILTLPLFSTLTGHAFSQSDHLLLRLSMDWIHSLSVGVWSGGLLTLFVWLGRRIKVLKLTTTLSYRVVTRFSHFAIASTAIIFLTGTTLTYLSGVDPFNLLKTNYGRIVCAKFIAFLLTLAIASINQFIHLRRGLGLDEVTFAKNIRREVGLEISILFVIFLLAAFLSRTVSIGT